MRNKREGVADLDAEEEWGKVLSKEGSNFLEGAGAIRFNPP